MLVDKTAVEYLKDYFHNDSTSFAISGVAEIFHTDIFGRQSSSNLYESSFVHSSYDYNNLRNNKVSNQVMDKLLEDVYNVDYYTTVFQKGGSYRYSPLVEGYSSDKHLRSLQNMLKYNSFGKKSVSFETKDIMFPGIRYVGDNIIIFEMPPSFKHIDYKEAYRENEGNENEEIDERSYYIPIPWQIYIASFSEDNMRVQQVQMYFSNSPLTSFDHQLYLPPLLNFYSNGVLCRPMFASMEDIEKYPQNISGVMASAYDWIWNSGFNFDIRETVSEFIVSNNWKKMLELSTLNLAAKQAAEILLSQIKISRNDLPSSVIRTIYSLWASVPIEKILECSWISFCKDETWFSYEIRRYAEQNWKEVSDWTKQNLNLTLIGDPEDEDDIPEDMYNEDGNPSFVTFSALPSHSGYYKWVLNKLHTQTRSLFDAWGIADSFVKSNFKNKKFKVDIFDNFLESQIQFLTSQLFSADKKQSVQ